jgi:choline-phosphate cytidylyltransferase
LKKVITYGTFDFFHEGHKRLLERAKSLGDYLIVGVTTDNYDRNRGKLNVHQSLMERIENVKKSGLADQIIIEEYEGQKINDIQENNIDIFVIGSDWIGEFDYLKDYCKVKYLERTKGISSTKLRNKNNGIIKLGIIGYGRIANRFIHESKYVSGVNVEGVYGPNKTSLKKFTKEHELAFYDLDFYSFLNKVDAVYIASPHLTHYEYTKKSLLAKKHVLCEKPIVLKKNKAEELYSLAKDNNLVLVEAIKTAFAPGFLRLVALARSGIIGQIKNIDATFTKLVKGELRELDPSKAGGSVNELASYPLLAIIKLLGINYKNLKFYSYFNEDTKVDLFTKINILYENAIATAKIGLGVKSEGDLVISGTKGYIYVPAPWWKTSEFEVKFEDFSNNQNYHYQFKEDGLRYELAEFVTMINENRNSTYKLTSKESIKISEIIDEFRNRREVINI